MLRRQLPLAIGVLSAVMVAGAARTEEPSPPPSAAPPAGAPPAAAGPTAATLPPAQAPAASTAPAWQRYAVAAPPAEGRPTISLMLDDMGLSRPLTARAAALPGPLTLSWFPYAPHVAEQAAIGTAHGHETMLHMPMEALGHDDPGPNTLRTWLPMEVNQAYLRAALDGLPHAVGLNQHEGTIASLSVPLMDMVMGELHARGMLFVDSKVVHNGVALNRAFAAGLPAAPRDVFIDNTADPATIRAQLATVETIARHYGHVIAIGHPRPATLAVLEQYLPTVTQRGFVLWPVSATVGLEMHTQMVRAGTK